MSRRIYKKDLQEIIIESVGEPRPAQDSDIWYVTVVPEEDVELRSILYTREVKELVDKLESKGWTKENTSEKAT